MSEIIENEEVKDIEIDFKPAVINITADHFPSLYKTTEYRL